MKLKPIIICLVLFMYLTMPVLAATGEDNVKIIKGDGSVSTDGIKKTEDNSASDSKSSEDSDSGDSSDTDDIDVWGIQQSDVSITNYADLGFLGRIYSGVTPLRNVSLLGIAVSFGLSLTAILVGAFILVFLAGIGGIHPNTKRGMDLIHGARGRLLGIFGVFFLALFMIILAFFIMSIFQKLSLFVA